MQRSRQLATSVFVLVSISSSVIAKAADWPTWRHDAGRSGATQEELPAELKLEWTLEAPAPAPAWEEDRRLQFDRVLEPVVVGNTMFLASNRTDSITAVDVETLTTRWHVHVGSPIRLAPVASSGKLYFGADDGRVYCVDAANGARLWSHEPVPSRLVLGNGRISSARPVRGGLVLQGGTLHFTTGVWPFEGTFLHRIDVDRPHDVSSQLLDDLAPQGYLVAAGGAVFLPAGRANVGAYDVATGAKQSLRYASKGHTDFHVVASERYLLHGGRVYDRQRKGVLPIFARRPVLDGAVLYGTDGGSIRAADLDKVREVEGKDRRGKKTVKLAIDSLWQIDNADLANRDTVLARRAAGGSQRDPKAVYNEWLKEHPLVVSVKAGRHLYGYQDRTVFSIDTRAEPKPSVVWRAELGSQPRSLVVAAGRLLVSTISGDVHSFRAGAAEPRVTSWRKSVEGEKPASVSDRLRRILAAAGDAGAGGYCVMLGLGSGELLEEIVATTKLAVVVIEADATKAKSTSRSLAERGVYGERVTILPTRADLSRLPPYLANLVVCGDRGSFDLSSDRSWVSHVVRLLRPYGGTARLELSESEQLELVTAFVEKTPEGVRVQHESRVSIVRRPGSLPGAADWKREYGDDSNTLMSRDGLVRAPLGVLWYGGPAGDEELFYNRHNWPPSLTVVAGRMFIQGPGTIAAIDIYTGRLLWRKDIDDGGGGVGRRYDLTKVSGDRMGNPIFGTPAAGYHFLVEEDALYLAYPESCVVLDPRTGNEIRKLELPVEDREWGRIRCHGDLLIVPTLEKRESDVAKQRLPLELLALDRQTGELRWRHPAKNALPFVAVGKKKIYCFDAELERLYRDKRRKNGVPNSKTDKLLTALDIQTGKEIWSKPIEMIAAWLAFSPDHDIVIASNSEEIRAFHGSDGYEMWKKKKKARAFGGHPENLVHKVILWKDRIIDQRGPGVSYDLKTGVDRSISHPLSGEKVAWEFTKTGHHCNYAIASEHLLTFRAAEAGFHDLLGGGTSRLEGFRSGCRNSLIPAGGVLNAPNFANGCVCSYSIFTSLAFVHVPTNEKWAYSAYKAPKERISSVGINFAAPGDRKSENGTLWLDFPNVGGPSPAVTVRTVPERPATFRRHSEQVRGDGPAWVQASGFEALESVTVALGEKDKGDEAASYTVRLYFCDADSDAAGQRVFDVRLQGKPVLQRFDIRSVAGAKSVGVVREFRDVKIDEALRVEFQAVEGKPLVSGVEVIAN